MKEIDFEEVVLDCIEAAKGMLGKSWKEFKPYAEHEFRQFTENAEFLAKMKLSGAIGNEELKARLDIQRLALKNVMLAVKGIGLVMAQKAINAVLAIVGKAINKALGVVLPVYK